MPHANYRYAIKFLRCARKKAWLLAEHVNHNHSPCVHPDVTVDQERTFYNTHALVLIFERSHRKVYRTRSFCVLTIVQCLEKSSTVDVSRSVPKSFGSTFRAHVNTSTIDLTSIKYTRLRWPVQLPDSFAHFASSQFLFSLPLS